MPPSLEVLLKNYSTEWAQNTILDLAQAAGISTASGFGVILANHISGKKVQQAHILLTTMKILIAKLHKQGKVHTVPVVITDQSIIDKETP